MAILDKGSESRQIALGKIVTILACQPDSFLDELADSLDRRLNQPQQPQLKLALSLDAGKDHERSPAAGMATKSGRGTPT